MYSNSALYFNSKLFCHAYFFAHCKNTKKNSTRNRESNRQKERERETEEETESALIGISTYLWFNASAEHTEGRVDQTDYAVKNRRDAKGAGNTTKVCQRCRFICAIELSHICTYTHIHTYERTYIHIRLCYVFQLSIFLWKHL